MRIKEKLVLILPVLLVFMSLLAAPQQAGAADVKKLAFSMKQVYVETGKSGSLDSIGLRVLATLDNGLEQDVTDDCTLTSSKETILTVNGQTITAVAKGSAAIKAAYNGKTANLSIKVIDPVQQFTLSATNNLTLQKGGSYSVKAQLEFTDSSVNPLNVSSYCNWTSDDDEVVSVKSGKLKALATTNDTEIQAECVLLGSTLPPKTITVAVISPIAKLTANPFSLSGAAGNTAQLVVKPVDKEGDVGSDVASNGAQFSSTNIKVVTVSDTGEVTFVAAGTARITAGYAGKIVSIPVKVIDSGSVTLETVPANLTELQLVAGTSKSIRFKNTATSQYVTSYVNLSSDNTTVASTAPGRISALSPGTAVINYSYGGQSGAINVEVVKKVSSLSVETTSINIAAGQAMQLVLSAKYADKTTDQVTGDYTSGDTSIATVDASGMVTGVAAGETKITAEFAGKTVTIPVTVLDSDFAAITFSTSKTTQGPNPPDNITYNIATGNSLNIYAQAIFTSSFKDITGQCAWTSDDTSVATVSSSGVVAAKKAGATRITATFGDKSSSFMVNTWPNISSITVTPNSLGFFGSSDAPKQISSIIAKFSDGSERDLQPSEISWVSNNESLVTVDSNGKVSLATPFKTGSTTVKGTFAGKTFTVDVTVSPQITDFNLSTSSITLITGTATTFKVTAQYLDNTYSDVTRNCTYTSGSGVTVDPDKGTITAATGATAAGTVEVTLQGTTKYITYTIIAKPDSLGLELIQDPDTAFSEDNLISNNGTFYFNIANQSETFNLYVHSTDSPEDENSRISGDSLLSVFSSNNKVAMVNYDSGDSAYKLSKDSSADTGSTAVITAYFLNKSFKFTVRVDLVKPDTPVESGTTINGSTQKGNFSITVNAEAGSSVTATVSGANVLSGSAESVTATTAGKATLSIDMSKLPASDGPYGIVIIATDVAGNPSDALTLTITKDTTPPDTPEEDVALKKDGTTQSGNFDITIANAEQDSTLTAKRGSSSIASVTASTAGTVTLSIDITKLAEGNNSIVITATDEAGNVSTPLTVTVTKDTTGPAITSVTATQVDGGGDTIVVKFDENLENGSGQVSNSANWTIEYADNASGANITNITTTNAGFVYDDTLKTLTITLDEATDQAYLPGGKYVKVTPNSANISDIYGNAGMTAAYSAAVSATDTTGPAVAAPGWATTANPNEFTVHYSEVLDRGTAIKDNWTFTDANSLGVDISSVALDADGKTLTVTLSGAIESGDNIITTSNVKDLAGKSVVDTGYTVP